MAFRPEDFKHLLELVGDGEDVVIYKLKVKWLEYQQEQASKPTKRVRKTT
jgi:hypothetical protein